MEVWQPAYIGLGSNQGDPPAQIRKAIERLAALQRTRVIAVSPLFGSKPFGPIAQSDFANAVAGVLTQLTPEELLAELKAIERAMGRPENHEKWGPRTMDLDLLLHGRERRDAPHLALPHPGIVERNFVLYPLAAIAPDLDVPGLGPLARLRERVGSEGLWPLEPLSGSTSA
jgi:2-amino-4-hydroxy-6-hydroxymethyldihydropteridine diphosphokinase